jgi:chemotaxis protein methyltransferase CheR
MEMDLYHQVKETIWKLLGINLDHYKDEHMRRRLDTWLFRSGALDWDEYIKRLRCDTKELSRFRDYLTINVSSFFRDLDRWQRLEEILAQKLHCESRGRNEDVDGLRVWSAGCSFGAEPYSLAILLEELSQTGRHHILATDLDRSALARSLCRGPYNSEEVQNISLLHRDVYLEWGGPPFFVRDYLARKVEFREHNLLADPFPEEMDLIVCRNVVIYLTEQTQRLLYRKFHVSLRAGGILFLGGTELIPHSREFGFRQICPSFYQKEHYEHPLD